MKDHLLDAKAGRVSLPSHRNKDAGVLCRWRGVRLEALRQLFGFGVSEPTLLSDPFKQSAVLACFLDDRPYLQMPQSTGTPMEDTIQAVWQVYLFLSEVGSEVADRETDQMTLRLKKRNIMDDLVDQAAAARVAWQGYQAALQVKNFPIPPLPETLLELVFEDVTRKSKSIAITSIFGPSYEENIVLLRSKIKDPDATAKFDSLMREIFAAKNPDDVKV